VFIWPFYEPDQIRKGWQNRGEPQASAKEKIKIEHIESFVGRKATISTLRKHDKDALEIGNIVIDPKDGQTVSLSDATNVVYWIRPVTGTNPTLIGLAWTKHNEIQVFTGTVCPP
jgi:hypothetical protein